MDFAKQLKSSVDIVKVIGEVVRLKKASANRYAGLCPFHTEKTPSFSVSTLHQFYKCFGCDAKGDVIRFVMEFEHLTFPEALKTLADRNGIPMPQRHEYHDNESRLRNALYEMHQIAAKTFSTNLTSPAGAEAREYLRRRGLSSEAIEHFGLGYSNRAGQDLVQQFRQFAPEQLEASGLVRKRNEGPGFYDAFRGRLMFPIHDEQGQVIAFGGRALGEGDEPKYLNSPETPIYKKSSLLYNLHRSKETIRKSGYTVLVEGYMDVIGVYSAGVRNVVASCGTSLTAGHVRTLRRHSESIVVNFDPDAAGEKATERSIQMLLEERMRVKILELEGGLDPDEFVKKHGADIYREKLEKASGYFLWLAERARKKFDMRTSEGRIDGLKFLLPAVERIPDKLERAAVADEVAGYLNIDRGLVLDQFRKTAMKGHNEAASNHQPTISRTERIMLRSLLAGREIREILVPQLRSSPLLPGWTTRNILQVLFSLHDSDPDFAFPDIEGRLEDRDKSLLLAVVFADNTDETFTPEQALTYLGIVQADERQAEINQIRLQLKQAERLGQMEEALRLMQILSELQREDRGKRSALA
jgi:DNA primase